MIREDFAGGVRRGDPLPRGSALRGGRAWDRALPPDVSAPPDEPMGGAGGESLPEERCLQLEGWVVRWERRSWR